MIHFTQYDLIDGEDRRFTDEFISSVSVSVGKATVRSYKNSLGVFYLCLEDCGLSQAKKVKRKHIVYWLQELKVRQYAASTRMQQIFHVRLYLSWLYERKYSRKNPVDLLLPSDLPKLPKKLPRPLPPEVDKKLIEYLSASDNINDKCLLLMRYTGLRLSDLLQLEYDPVFKDDKGNSFLRVISPKFDKQYSLPVDKKTIQVILDLQTDSKHMMSGKQPQHLANDPKGRRLDSVIRNHLKFISPLVSDKPITPHQLRHTYATSLINAGMGLYSVMKLLGHMDMRMTLRYAALYPVTLHKEYHSALKKISQKYETQNSDNFQTIYSPSRALDDLNHWIRNNVQSNDKKILKLIKRISRLKRDIEELINQEKGLP